MTIISLGKNFVIVCCRKNENDETILAFVKREEPYIPQKIHRELAEDCNRDALFMHVRVGE